MDRDLPRDGRSLSDRHTPGGAHRGKDAPPAPGRGANGALLSDSRQTGTVVFTVTVTSLLVAALLGELAKTAAWTRIDVLIEEAVHGLRTPWLTVVADALRIAFLPEAAWGLCGVTVVVLLLLRRPGGALLTIAVFATSWGLNSFFKAAIARPRPDPATQLDLQTGLTSFPSGHVAVTLALVVVWCLAVAGTAAFRPVVAAGAVLVASQMFARVYLGAHHPTDVVGALLVVGAASTAVIAVLAPLTHLDRHRTTTPDPPAHRSEPADPS